jgi:hypothetical protein
MFRVIGLALILSAIPPPIFAASLTPDPGTPVINLPISLSGVVYLDRNQNGKIDANEFAINTATVQLFNANDLTTALATQFTDSHGGYTFANLAPGSYVVRSVTPSATNPTPTVGFITDSLNQQSILSGLGTADESQSQIESIALNAGYVAQNYNFAMASYPVQLISKRMLLASGGEPAYQVNIVPEPGTLLLLLTTGLTLGLWQIKRLAFSR